MPERKRVTLEDVAVRVGVSAATVSRALNDPSSVQPATRDAIIQAARAVGYIETPSADLAVIWLPDRYSELRNHFFMNSVIQSLYIAAQRQNVLPVLLGSKDMDSAMLKPYLPALRGALLIPRDETLHDEERAVLALGKPSVIIGSIHYDLTGFPLATVLDIHNRGAGRIAAEELLKLGHTRIAHIAGPEGRLGSLDRRLGFEDVVRERALAPSMRADYIVTANEWFETSGYEAMQTLLALPEAEWPTGVFCASDTLASGAVKAIRERGLEAPRHFSIVGHDNSEYASRHDLQLSTVDPRLDLVGREALALLDQLARLAPGDPPLPARQLQPQFVARKSTDKPRQ